MARASGNSATGAGAAAHRAYIGLGGNLGDARASLAAAIDALAARADTRVAARSSLYRSAPIGYAEQPAFLNAVVAIDTTLEPLALLDVLQAIETAHGRVRSFKDAPRTLDLDLLLYDDLVLAGARLTLPHPRMTGRAFVLAPLAEIAPDVPIGGAGVARELLARVADQAIERLGTV